jgi:hypothetical protein
LSATAACCTPSPPTYWATEARSYGRISFRGNTGLSIIEINDGYATLVRLNDTSHLE